MKPYKAASHRRLCFVCTLLQSTRTTRNAFPNITQPKPTSTTSQNPRPAFDTIPRVLLTENSSARLSTPSTTRTDRVPRLQSSLVCQPPLHNRTPPAPSAGASTSPERASQETACKHCRSFNAPNACTALPAIQSTAPGVQPTRLSPVASLVSIHRHR